MGLTYSQECVIAIQRVDFDQKLTEHDLHCFSVKPVHVQYVYPWNKCNQATGLSGNKKWIIEYKFIIGLDKQKFSVLNCKYFLTHKF